MVLASIIVLCVSVCIKSELKVVGEGQAGFCSEQHFCSCPPFLKYKLGHDDEIHFTKHNYDEQYAILGKSKVLGTI